MSDSLRSKTIALLEKEPFLAMITDPLANLNEK
jgi:hypothetical protein